MQIHHIISAAFALCALSLTALAGSNAQAQSAQQFELPPAPAPSETPQVQGPVDTDGPVPVAPRAIETEPPSPSPVPTETFEPIFTAPSDDAQGEAPAQAQPRSAPQPVGQTAAPAPQTVSGADSSASSQTPTPTTTEPTAAPAFDAPAQETTERETAEIGSQFWLWIAGVAALLLAAAGMYFLRRSQAAKPAPTIAPPIVRPDADDHEDTAAHTPVAPTPAIAEPLGLQVEVISLSRSLMNATLAYRVTVLNKTNETVSDIALGADLTSAGQGRPMEQQVALPDTALPIRHETPRMSSRQSARFEGQVQLPLNQAVAIRQGKTALLVPLLRLRLTAEGADPIVKTLVIGQAGGNSGLGGNTRLQPFALDDGPRSWSPIAHRQLDALSPSG